MFLGKLFENLYAFIAQQKLLLVGVKYDSSQKL